MEEAPRSKRRRVCSFNPNAIIYTTFSHKYMSYLLPALLRAANYGHKTAHFENIVRFEVEMALVLSTDEFKWSRVLKQKLEEGSNTNSLTMSSKCSAILYFKRSDCLQTFPAIPRPIILVEPTRPRKSSQRSIKKRVVRGEEELACRIRILQRILPGGGKMGVFELLSEVESYVICLQLQVNVLRYLVDAQ